MHCCWAWRRWSLNINHLSWAPLPSRALSHGTLPSRSLKRPKSALPNSRVVSLLCTLLPALRILNSTVSRSLQSLELHVPHQPLLAGENKLQHSTSPHGLVYHLEKEVITKAFQEPPGLLMPCYAVLATDIGGVEVPHEDQGFWMGGCFHLPIEGLVRSVFLVGWAVADPRYNVTSPCPAFNPDL